MIHHPYNMVSLDNLDLAEANGDIVEGIYSKILEAMNACGVLMIANWRFADIPIPPSYCTILQFDGYITLNGVIKITSSDEVFIEGVYPDVVITPVQFTENGVYEATEGVDGYNPVTVEVPDPVIIEGHFIENGTFYVPEGVNGYNPIEVEVPHSFLNPIIGAGVFTSSADYGGFNCYYAAGSSSRNWWGGNGTSGWLKVELSKSTVIEIIKFSPAYAEGNYHWWSRAVTIEASNDDSSWTTIASISDLPDSSVQQTFQIQDEHSYRYWKFTCAGSGTFWVGLGKLQLYAKE